MGWLKDWKADKRSHVAIYHDFRDYAQQGGFCWSCGRTAAFRDKPIDYGAKWIIQRCHITSKPRLEDRRVVNLLCPTCHEAYDDAGDERITLSNMIFLKQLFDPEFFDIELLQRCSIRILPDACDLQADLIAEFQSRRGLTRTAVFA